MELLTPGELKNLFCELFKCSETTYYRKIRKQIKFRYYFVDCMPRIPRKIAIGLFHLLNESYDERRDPPVEKLKQFLV